jgi:hypothetical protein
MQKGHEFFNQVGNRVEKFFRNKINSALSATLRATVFLGGGVPQKMKKYARAESQSAPRKTFRLELAGKD